MPISLSDLSFLAFNAARDRIKAGVNRDLEQAACYQAAGMSREASLARAAGQTRSNNPDRQTARSAILSTLDGIRPDAYFQALCLLVGDGAVWRPDALYIGQRIVNAATDLCVAEIVRLKKDRLPTFSMLRDELGALVGEDVRPGQTEAMSTEAHLPQTSQILGTDDVDEIELLHSEWFAAIEVQLVVLAMGEPSGHWAIYKPTPGIQNGVLVQTFDERLAEELARAGVTIRAAATSDILASLRR